MRKGYVDTPTGQVHYRISGDTGPVVVLLHQTASSSRMFQSLMTELASSFRLIAFDTPGFGESDPHPHQPTIQDLAHTLHLAASELHLQNFQLLGHHTGAAIATQWAADAPNEVTSLTMIGALAMGDAERQQWSAGLKPASIEPDGSHLHQAWDRVANIDKQPVVFPPNSTLRHREAIDNLLAAPRWPEAYRAVFSHDFEHALQQVQCPQLLICGDEDILFPYLNATAELMKNGQVHTLHAGAYLLEQQLNEVLPVIRDFLSQHQ